MLVKEVYTTQHSGLGGEAGGLAEHENRLCGSG